MTTNNTVGVEGIIKEVQNNQPQTIADMGNRGTFSTTTPSSQQMINNMSQVASDPSTRGMPVLNMGSGTVPTATGNNMINTNRPTDWYGDHNKMNAAEPSRLMPNTMNTTSDDKKISDMNDPTKSTMGTMGTTPSTGATSTGVVEEQRNIINVPTGEVKAPEYEKPNHVNNLLAGSTLYYARQYEGYDLPEDEWQGQSGVFFFVTPNTALAMSVEEWVDFYLNKYEVQTDCDVPPEFIDKNMSSLYDEIPMLPDSAKIFLPSKHLNKLQLVDAFKIDHELIAQSYGIDRRRFVKISKGQIVYSADDNVITNPEPNDVTLGVYLYVTQILPEDFTLQRWKDQVLNVYVFRDDLILPYGKDQELDPYFEDKYIDTIESPDGSTKRLSSYYDDGIVGQYLTNKKNTAEIFLVDRDLQYIMYYGSYELKLDSVRYIHGIERPNPDMTID